MLNTTTPTLRTATHCLLVIALASCDPPPPAVDAGALDAGPTCAEDADCDDGLFCTGEERCVQSRCVSSARVDCDDGVACTLDRCDEATQRCVSSPPDLDGDGSTDAACLGPDGAPLGSDCDDSDATRFAGNVERCDVAGVDEDCNAGTFGVEDLDGDGVPSARCCNGEACGADCDDTRADVAPGTPEVCNGLDEDCDGIIDEGAGQAGFADLDADGRGDESAPMMGCPGQVRFSPIGGDCDDTDPTRRPGAPELCDGVDNDCDTSLDEDPVSVTWYVDADGDGYGDPLGDQRTSCAIVEGYSVIGTDCDDSAPAINPASAEICNGLDDDCNGSADFALGVNDFEDDDGDGVVDAACNVAGATDCDDFDARTAEGANETCDGRDNDCDDAIDEGAASGVFFRDVDGDGYGSAQSGAMVACVPISGYVPRGGDCDDGSPSVSPDAEDLCNGLDDDCDGRVDQDGAARCASGASCVDGACRLSCEVGHGDCDGQASNGCEADLSTNADHCGGCGVSCGLGGVCSEGTCAPIRQLALGAQFSCALRSDSAVVCWGSNSVGQLGQTAGSPASSNEPVLVPLPGVPVRVAAGDAHACAVLEDESLHCWGGNSDGELARGTLTPSGTPGPIVPALSFDRVSAGGHHTCALTPSHEVYCWGRTDRGQVGSGSSGSGISTPTLVVSQPAGIEEIALGFDFSCAFTFGDELFCWGNGNENRFGLPASGIQVTALRTPFEGFSPSEFLGAAGDHACGRERDTGAVYCWGVNTDGAAAPGMAQANLPASPLDPEVYASDVFLGATTTSYVAATGVLQVSSASGFQPAPANLHAVAGNRYSQGGMHQCVVRNGHTVFCWGDNSHGQCGVDPAAAPTVATPSRVPNL